MFTGIIEETGKIKSIRWGTTSATFEIFAKKVLADINIGDSISTNGVCLTVTSFDSNSFSVDVMTESMQRTNLKELKPGSLVNLERALRLSDRLGGHMVSGHVDDTGIISNIHEDELSTWYTIQAKPEILRYIILKGSIAIDGISLTVSKIEKDSFKVSIIPHTAQNTTLIMKKMGNLVNLECDLVAKYIEKMTNLKENNKTDSKIDLEFLKDKGFL